MTGTIQLLLWRDRKTAARVDSEGSLPASGDSASPPLQESDVDEKKAVRVNEVPL